MDELARKIAVMIKKQAFTTEKIKQGFLLYNKVVKKKI